MKFFLNKHILLTTTFSFAFLVLGLIGFENTVANNRSQKEQIASYLPGENIALIKCFIFGATEDGEILAIDQFGGLIKTDQKMQESLLNSNAFMKGKMGGNREFIVDKLYPHIDSRDIINVKVGVSLIVLCYIFLKLYFNLKATANGLIISADAKE